MNLNTRYMQFYAQYTSSNHQHVKGVNIKLVGLLWIISVK